MTAHPNHKSFKSAHVTQHFFVLSAREAAGKNIAAQLDDISLQYLQQCRAMGIAPESISRKFLVSDIANQASDILSHPTFQDSESHPAAIAIVQQQPLEFGARVTLIAHHITGASHLQRKKVAPGHVLIDGTQTPMLLADLHVEKPVSTYDDTRQLFDAHIRALNEQGGTLKDNGVRTWIFVDGIDKRYPDMVRGRNEAFAREGITGNPRYMASTGIGGQGRTGNVQMGFLSLPGLKPEQVIVLNAPDWLNAPRDYHPTPLPFERGLKVSYRDCNHLYLSEPVLKGVEW